MLTVAEANILVDLPIPITIPVVPDQPDGLPVVHKDLKGRREAAVRTWDLLILTVPPVGPLNLRGICTTGEATEEDIPVQDQDTQEDLLNDPADLQANIQEDLPLDILISTR